jgi:hypothetical protein
MNRYFLAIFSTALVLPLTGCQEKPTPGGNPKANASTDKPNLPPPPPPSETTPAIPASPTSPTGPSPQPPAGPVSIALSTGVALPQPSINGTILMFSVDYEFTQGQPDPAGYVWVIERAKGTPAKVGVKLGPKNNLMVPMTKWRPEDGPFKSHIEDSKGNRLSESIEMR